MILASSIDTESATISKFDDDIVQIRFKDGIHLVLDEAKVIGDAAIDVSDGNKFLALIDATKIFSTMAPDAMEYFTHNRELINLRMAQAIVVDNLPIKLIANFYIRVKKPAGAVKTFGKLEDAISWLSDRRHLVTSNYFEFSD